jgi:hypothetical protein
MGNMRFGHPAVILMMIHWLWPQKSGGYAEKVKSGGDFICAIRLKPIFLSRVENGPVRRGSF